MRIEFVAGASAWLHVDEKQIKAAFRSGRTKQLLGDTGAPQVQPGTLRLASNDGIRRGAGILLGAEQPGDADAQHVRECRQHPQRRRRQPTFDLAEKANRQISAGRNRLERHGAGSP